MRLKRKMLQNEYTKQQINWSWAYQKLNEKFTLSVGVAEMAEEDYADLLIARTQAALDRAVSEGGDQTSH